MKYWSLCLLIGLLLPCARSAQKPNELEAYLASLGHSGISSVAYSTPGSLFSSSAPLASLGLDIKARGLHDIVTVIVQEKASAVSSGTVNSTRQSSLKSSIGELYGPASQALNRLGSLSTNTGLTGDGTTSRESVLNTSIAVHVVHVLPNGNLVVEGMKNVVVNAENQIISLRGVVRPADISSVNTVFSEKIAAMEVKVNGKGVVGDAIRRPFILYRILLGLLPF